MKYIHLPNNLAQSPFKEPRGGSNTTASIQKRFSPVLIAPISRIACFDGSAQYQKSYCSTRAWLTWAELISGCTKLGLYLWVGIPGLLLDAYSNSAAISATAGRKTGFTTFPQNFSLCAGGAVTPRPAPLTSRAHSCQP